jgi:hypothetical protein
VQFEIQGRADQGQMGEGLWEVPALLPGAVDLLGVQAEVVGVRSIFSNASRASSRRPARVSASTYQNEQIEKVPSSPRSPSGLACGSWR